MMDKNQRMPRRKGSAKLSLILYILLASISLGKFDLFFIQPVSASYTPLTIEAQGGSPQIRGVNKITFIGASVTDANNGIVLLTANGDITSSANFTDNALIRGDGGTQQIQDSAIIIDDSDNITGVTSLDIDGTTGNSFTVNGDSLVVNATNGRVGIGTASPDYPLEVRLDQNNGTVATVKNDNASAKAYAGVSVISNSSAGAMFAVDDSYTANTYIADKFMLQSYDVANGMIITSGSGSGIEFHTNGSTPTASTQAMSITADRNVGIGIATPDSQLHINGNNAFVTIEDDTYARIKIITKDSGSIGSVDYWAPDDAGNDTVYAGTVGFVANDSNGNEDGYLYFTTTQSGSSREVMRLDQNGNVSIGIETSNELLTVNGVTSFREVAAPSNTSGYGKIYVGTNSKLYFLDDAGTSFALQNGSTTGDYLASNSSDNYTSGTLTLDASTELNAAASSTVDIDGNLEIADTDISLDGANTTFTQTTGDITMVPASNDDFAVTLSGTGDFVVDTDKLVVNDSGQTIIGASSITGSYTSTAILATMANQNSIAPFLLKNTNTGTSADSRILIQGDDNGYLAIATPGTNNNLTMFGLNRNASSLIFTNYQVGTDQRRDLGIGTFQASDLILGTQNLERARITSDGRMGIGTTSPEADLEVGNGTAANIDGNGDLLVEDDVEINGDLYVDGTFNAAHINGTSLEFGMAPGAVAFANGGSHIVGDADNFYYDSNNGRLGINTNNPLADLAVGTGSFNPISGTGLSYALASFSASGDTSVGVALRNPNGGVNNLASYSISDPSGNNIQMVMPGEAYSSNYLDRQGNGAALIAINGADNRALGMGTVGNGDVYLATDDTERLTIDGVSGNVGIGTTTPVGLLAVNGSSNEITGVRFQIQNMTDGTNGRAIINAKASNDRGFSLFTTSPSYTFNPDWDNAAVLTGDFEELNIGLYQNGDIKFHLGGTADTNVKAIITNNGDLGVGTINPGFTLAGSNNRTHIHSRIDEDAAIYNFVAEKQQTNRTPAMAFMKARDGGTTLTSADSLGFISFFSHDGTDYNQSAYIRAAVDGTPAANDTPGRLTFATTPSGSNSPTVRLAIRQNGNIGIGTEDPTALLDLNGTLAVRGGSPAADKILRSDADGDATWVTMGSIFNGSGLTTNAAGSEGYIQFNNGGNFNGTANLVWDSSTERLDVNGANAMLNLYNTSAGDFGIGYETSEGSGTTRYILIANNSTDTVALANRAPDGIAQIRANNGTAGAAGEQIVAQFEDDQAYFGGSSGSDAEFYMDFNNGGLGVNTGANAGIAMMGSDILGLVHSREDADIPSHNFVAEKQQTNRNPGFIFAKANTGGAIVDDNAVLGGTYFTGHDGTDYNQAAYIAARVDGTPGTDDMPGRIIFATSPLGSNTPVERMTIRQNGDVAIGAVTPEALLDVGNGEATSIDGTDDLLVGDDVEIDGDLYIEGNLNAAHINGTSLEFGVTTGGVAYSNGGSHIVGDADNFFYSESVNGLGLGTNTPDSTLHVDGSFRYVDGNETNGYILSSNDNGVASWVDVSSVVDSPWTSASNATYLTTALDKVGIGFTSPDFKLAINGAMSFGEPSGGGTIAGPTPSYISLGEKDFTAGSANNGTVTAPATISENNTLIAVVHLGSGSATVTGTPAGWTSIESRCRNECLYTYYKVATGSEPADYTFNYSATVFNEIVILNYANGATSSPVPVSAGADSLVSPSVTTTVDNSRVVRVAACDDDSNSFFTSTNPSGHDIRHSTSGSSYDEMRIADIEQASAGATGTATFTNNDGTNCFSITMAISSEPQSTGGDPSDPSTGKSVFWQADSDSSLGSNGDLLVKVTANGTTNNFSLFDHSINSLGGTTTNAYFNGLTADSSITYVDGNEAADKILRSDINGVASWVTLGSIYNGAGLGASAAGSEGHIQFNNGSGLGGNGRLFWDDANGNLGIGTTIPTRTLSVEATAISGREGLASFTVSDGGNDEFLLANNTNTDSRFVPQWIGHRETSTQPAVAFVGQTIAGQDLGTDPIIRFDTRRVSGDKLNGTFSSIVTRPLFQFTNDNSPIATFNANGNLGIGTTIPSTILEVNGALSFTNEEDNGNSGASATIDFTDGNKQTVTLNNNTTLTLTSPGVGNYLLRVVQDGTGSRTVTWAASSGSIKWPSATPPTLSTAASSEDIITCYHNGTDFYCQASLDFQ